MHKLKIIHRDIKSDNIVCNSDGQIKIADLGLSVQLTKEQPYRKTVAGSDFWISPDIILGHVYNEKVDVWSFGAFVYELGAGKPPFEGKSFDYMAKSSGSEDIRCPT